MARRRQYIEDIVYAEEHRNHLPNMYRRIGHRLYMADRDFTEFCYYCKAPIAIIELVRYIGQDLRDKGVTVTTQLARAASIRGAMVAYMVERPADVQNEIDNLGKRLMLLQTSYPISGFIVKSLNPAGHDFVRYDDPEQYWKWIYTLHREHHACCRTAKRCGEFPVNCAKLNDEIAGSKLLLPVQSRLI